MSAIQLIQITPDELQRAILKGVRQQVSELKEHFQPKHPTEYLTRKQTAELLQVDLSTLYSWNKKGILQPLGIGKRVYYRREDIEQALTEL